MRYRRSDIAGATYFFTVNLADRDRTLLIDHVHELRDVMRAAKQRHPFHIDALVVLPDHLHALITLPEGDADYPTRWALIKVGFSRCVANMEPPSTSRIKKGERGIWQRRYWEHSIRDDDDYARHVDYIHFNPVKHGHVTRAVHWVHSSIHRSIAVGTIGRDWGGGGAEGRSGVWGEAIGRCWGSLRSPPTYVGLFGFGWGERSEPQRDAANYRVFDPLVRVAWRLCFRAAGAGVMIGFFTQAMNHAG